MSGQSTDSDVASPQTAAHPAPVAIKACPFCGGGAIVENIVGGGNCVHCEVCGGEGGYRDDALAAIAAWNSRSGTDELVAALKGFLSCPEIADCAPDDKDSETDDLERTARALIAKHESR